MFYGTQTYEKTRRKRLRAIDRKLGSGCLRVTLLLVAMTALVASGGVTRLVQVSIALILLRIGWSAFRRALRGPRSTAPACPSRRTRQISPDLAPILRPGEWGPD